MPRRCRRTLQRHILCATLTSIVASISTVAQDSDTLDCSNAITVDDVSTYDLAPLTGEHIVSRTRDTPPSTMEDQLQFNLCEDLSRKEEVAEADQCPTGTRACLIKTNKKSGTDDRVVAAIPVAQTATLKPLYSTLQSPAGLSVVLHGPSYPPSTSPAQSFNLTLLCTHDGASDPKFVSYESGMVSVEWGTSAGCPTKRTEGGGDGDGNGDTGNKQEGEGGQSTSGSGIGWFFLLLFISFAGYFALGAYYNYNNFGATGWDLIPHRDFWRDVPYLLRDFTDHLCSTLRPGRQAGSRRGYMAV